MGDGEFDKSPAKVVKEEPAGSWQRPRGQKKGTSHVRSEGGWGEPAPQGPGLHLWLQRISLGGLMPSVYHSGEASSILFRTSPMFQLWQTRAQRK